MRIYKKSKKSISEKTYDILIIFTLSAWGLCLLWLVFWALFLIWGGDKDSYFIETGFRVWFTTLIVSFLTGGISLFIDEWNK